MVEEEYSRIEKIMKHAHIVFKTDFRYEYRYLHGDNASQMNPGDACLNEDPLGIKEEIKNSNSSTFKKLRNELAKVFHPDAEKESKTEKFKEIQEAYESGNFSKLIDTAIDNDISIRLSEEDASVLESIINKQREYINTQKSTAEWFWYYSSRTSDIRELVWKGSNIDGDAFKIWLINNSSNLKALEDECVARLVHDKIIDNVPSYKAPRRAPLLLTTK